jgi:hypothetical protein
MLCRNYVEDMERVVFVTLTSEKRRTYRDFLSFLALVTQETDTRSHVIQSLHDQPRMKTETEDRKEIIKITRYFYPLFGWRNLPMKTVKQGRKITRRSVIYRIAVAIVSISAVSMMNDSSKRPSSPKSFHPDCIDDLEGISVVPMSRFMDEKKAILGGI